MKIPPHNYFQSVEDLLGGSILIIDKPLRWTSFDVVNKIKTYIRRSSGEGRIKVGHAGTLDPLATGLLVVCTGAMTKRIEEIQQGEKEYTGTIVLGKTTPSYDLETTPEGDYPFLHLSDETLYATAAAFIGEQWQRPPDYSARRIKGKRAYLSARKGIAIDIPPSKIAIHQFELTRISLPEIHFKIRCSKGTYIRTMAHEFGQRMQSGSYLSALRRTRSFPFSIDQAIKMEEVYARLQANSEVSIEKKNVHP